MHNADRRTLLVGGIGLLGGIVSATIDWYKLYGYNANVDIVAHFGGGLFVAAVFAVALHGRLRGRRFALAVVIGTLAIALGWEAFEVVSPWHTGYFELGADDTQGDILAGCVAAPIILWVQRRSRSD